MMTAQSENTCMILSVVNCNSCCFAEHYFYLKKWLTDKLWLFRLGYLADIFIKMNEMQNDWCLLVKIKFDLLIKIRILENLCQSLWVLVLSNTKTFLMRLVVIGICVKFQYCTMKFSVFGNPRNSLNWYFPNE